MGSEPKPGPCPFCGSEDYVLATDVNEYGSVSSVACDGCMARGPDRATVEEAVSAWASVQPAARAEAAEQRAEAAEREVAQLRAELARTKMAVATALSDLPVWSESALAHLSPAERGADEVRAALGRFMRAEANRHKGAAEARPAGEVAQARAEGAAAERARIASVLHTHAERLRARKALGLAAEVEALAVYIGQPAGEVSDG